MPSVKRKGPLARFTVLDLTRARSGPTCARMLADWGADVIKVEEPGDQDGDGGPFDRRHGSDFQNLQRNRRSITLNFKSKEGLAVFRRMVRKADVIVENFRPRVKHRLGIDYASVRRINKRIVYGSISGFGETGPYSDRPGLDQVAQGMSGLMSITGLPGHGPVRVGCAVGDTTAGMFCSIGILMALLEREQSGEGQWVQSSLVRALISVMDFQAARWLMDREIPLQAGNNHPTAIPTGVYRTSDGYMTIAGSGALYERLCRALGAPELITHPDYSNFKARQKNRDALNAEIESRTRTKSTAAWIRIINAAGVPCGPIYNIAEMFADEQIRHVGMSVPVKHYKLGNIKLVAPGVKLTRTPYQIRTAAPDRGEHTEAILKEFGYNKTQIAALRAKGAV